MSFISVVAGVNFISIMSDGRVMKGNKIANEKHQKFKMIGDKTFIACAGNKGLIDGLLKSIDEELFAQGYFLPAAKGIQEAVKENEAFLENNLNIIIGGVNAQNQIEFMVLSTDQQTLTQSIPENSRTKFMTGYMMNAEKTKMGYEEVNQKFVQFLSDEKNFHKAQTKLHKYIADLDPTCNKKIFHEVIQLKRG